MTSHILQNYYKPAIASLATSSLLSHQRNDTAQCERSKQKKGLLFLGTGSSTGCPKPNCALLFNQNINSIPPTTVIDGEYIEKMHKMCRVSSLATKGDPNFWNDKNDRVICRLSIEILHLIHSDSTLTLPLEIFLHLF